MELVDYEVARDFLSDKTKQHLLLGNGFSIALLPKIFQYGSLFRTC